MKEYYDGGILKAEYQTKKGQKSGLYKEYYRDGSIMAKGHLENNLREGPWTYFTKNSQVKATGTYSSGLKTGIWIYDDGEKKVSWDIFKSEAHNFLINVPTTWKTETPLENVVQFTPTNLNGLPNNLTLVFTEPVVLISDTDFKVVDGPIKFKLIDKLYQSHCGYFRKDSGSKPTK